MAINLRKLHPMALTGRALHLQAIKEIGPELIFKTHKKNHCFLVEFDDGTHDIDWHFAIFEATEYQYGQLFDNFAPVQKEPEATEDIDRKPPSGIITEDPVGPRPDLIL